MTRPIRTFALAAALLLAIPACAQRQGSRTDSETRTGGRSGTHIIHNDGDHAIEIRSRGEVEINEAGDWVEALDPGASLSIEERRGGRERRVEFRPGDGGEVRVRLWVNGDERPMDAQSREWAREMIRDAVRENGLGAARRVARIRQRAGVDGVLRAIGDLRTDTGRRIYYTTLLRSGPMSAAEFGRVMDDAGRRMGSDTERRIVLIDAVDQAQGSRLASVLRAAGGMNSDTETRIVLTQVAARHRLDDAASRQTFFRAVEGMGSDVETRIVLHSVAEQRLEEGSSREAFFHAVDGIGSDTERRIVLTTVLREGSPEPTVLSALRSARGMGSDVEKRIVLYQVPTGLLRNPRVTAAYRQVVDAMSSDSERSLALRRLVDGGR